MWVTEIDSLQHLMNNVFCLWFRNAVDIKNQSLKIPTQFSQVLTSKQIRLQSNAYPRWCRSINSKTVWSMYSNTRCSRLLRLKTSIRLTKFVCFNCCKVIQYTQCWCNINTCLKHQELYTKTRTFSKRTSRKAIFLIIGSSSDSTNFFTATYVPVSLFLHLNTTPYEPSPILHTFSYFSILFTPFRTQPGFLPNAFTSKLITELS